MNSVRTASHSLWHEIQMPESERLQEDLRVDVCVIGGGIAGLSTAYMLARAGKPVAVLEADTIGGGETGHTTAHLSSAIDDRFVEIERLHGPEGARICAESHASAIETIERIVGEESIDCDFERVDGFLFHGDPQAVSLAEELEAAQRAGVEGVEIVPRAPIESFDTGACLRFPRQGQFHPLKYLRALAEAIQQRGGHLYSGTRVEDVEEDRPLRVVTSGGPAVTADAVVVATNSPINNRFSIHTKQVPYRTYVIAARLPSGAVTRALYWDTLDPYHYVRLAPSEKGGGGEFLIVGGEDRKPGDSENTDERFEDLERWARERFPMLEEVAFRWSGQVMEPVDGVAYIGRNPGGDHEVYVATGDSGMGMTHSTIAGILITDLIMGRDNSWSRLYDPSRITMGAAGPFLRASAEVVGRLAEWFSAGDVESADEIPPGSGAIVRRGLTKLAIYRDPEGRLHERQAACTHLGCLIAWNPVEESWDCPCHGSRFDPYGQVLNGPAVEELKPAGDR